MIRGDYGESGTKSCAEIFPEEDVVEETGRYVVNKKMCVFVGERVFLVVRNPLLSLFFPFLCHNLK